MKISSDPRIDRYQNKNHERARKVSYRPKSTPGACQTAVLSHNHLAGAAPKLQGKTLQIQSSIPGKIQASEGYPIGGKEG